MYIAHNAKIYITKLPPWDILPSPFIITCHIWHVDVAYHLSAYLCNALFGQKWLLGITQSS